MDDFKTLLVIRARIITLFLILFSFVIVARIFYIQYVLGPVLRKKAAKIHYEEKEIKPIRGNITDFNKNILATDLTFYSIVLDPSKFKKEDNTIIKLLANVLFSVYKDKSENYYFSLINKYINSNKRYLLVNRNKINHLQKTLIEKNSDLKKFITSKAIIFEKSNIRFNPFNSLAFRTLGYISDKSKGVGLEREYDSFLRGVPGKALYKRTIGSIYRVVENSRTVKPINGYDVETCIDINLQDMVHSNFLKVLSESMAERGCAIIMEVATGEVRAIVNLTRMHNGIYSENYNYAVTAREPGSVFKVASMIALLEEENIDLDCQIDLQDGFAYFYDRKMVESSEKLKGVMTLKKAFALSTNIGIAKIVVEKFGNNPKKFVNYIKYLGLGEISGIDIPGESKSLIPDPSMKIWSGTTVPWMTIGYCVQISPIKVLQLYNAIANNGVMVKPRLVKKIIEGNRVIKEFPTEIVVKKICSDKTLAKIRSLLEEVVESGSGRFSNDTYYKIAGKTGTANVLKNGRYSNETYITCVGYFPAEKPKYSFIFVMDSPKSMNWHFGASLFKIVKMLADKLASHDLSDITKRVSSRNSPQNHQKTFRNVNYKDLQYFSLFMNKKMVNRSNEKIGINNWCSGTIGNNDILIEKCEKNIYDHLSTQLFCMKDYVYLKDLYLVKLQRINYDVIKSST